VREKKSPANLLRKRGKFTGRLHVWETQGSKTPFQRRALELWRRGRCNYHGL
jgi:hypothetical protein